MRSIAPWTDFDGQTIRDGDFIIHPDGVKGIVVFRPKGVDASDKWLVDYGDGGPSRLCLQIGDKGRAVTCHPNYRHSEDSIAQELA